MLASSAARPFRKSAHHETWTWKKKRCSSQKVSQNLKKLPSETALLFTWTLLFWQAEAVTGCQLLLSGRRVLQMASFIFSWEAACPPYQLFWKVSQVLLPFCKRNKLQVHTVYFLFQQQVHWPVAVGATLIWAWGDNLLDSGDFFLGVLLANGM